MKNRNALLMCLALPSLALPLNAAPKLQVTQAKWEYCSMRYGSRSRAGLQTQAGAEIHLPNNRTFFQPINRGQDYLDVATQVLNRLGAQGWDLVNYSAEGSETWILKRRK